MKKLVLAYSGGLDTSYCVKYLTKEKGFEVHAVSINTGGFSSDEIAEIKEKALALGASTYTSVNAVKSYYENVIKYLIFGNVLRNNTYPLSVSAERIVQAIEIAKYSKKIDASYIAHGSTGAGNDQVRFDSIFQIMAPETEIITPIRDQQLAREEEIEYLKAEGIDMNWEKAKYSINKGLWGTSVGGDETLTSDLPLPDSAYPSQLVEKGTEKIKLSFDQGEFVALNDQADTPVSNIEKLNTLASKYAIGRDVH
ncbi:MAG: argininosuccinate synthase domain-containing protein, partial [Flavobacteriaceae bacterium]